MAEIPYPPVFKDWLTPERRVATATGNGGVIIETYLGRHQWLRCELTEEDACLLAASLLQRAGEDKLAKKVVSKVTKGIEGI